MPALMAYLNKGRDVGKAVVEPEVQFPYDRGGK
jgi:hypothetical protein